MNHFACMQIPGGTCGKWDDEAKPSHIKLLILGEWILLWAHLQMAEVSRMTLGKISSLPSYKWGTGLGTYLFSPSYSNLILTFRCWKKSIKLLGPKLHPRLPCRSKADRSSWEDTPKAIGHLVYLGSKWLLDSPTLGKCYVADKHACQRTMSSVNKRPLIQLCNC